MNKCPLCQKEVVKKDLELNYNCPNCHEYIMTFGFVGLLNQVEVKYGEKTKMLIINEVKEKIKLADRIIAFVDDYEKYQDYFDNIVEFSDICDKLNINIESNSRGSDYGD